MPMPSKEAAEKEAIKKYFRKVAPAWNEVRKGFYDERLRDAIIKGADIKEGDTVLDVACGTGFLTIMAARTVGEAGRVICVDLSEEMLQEARESLTKEGLIHIVELRIGDMLSLPLENNSMDAVICNMGLHHSFDPQLAIKEMVRVLKPKGRLIISDLEEHAEEWLRKEMADIWLGFSLQRIRQMFKKAGLSRVKVKLARTKCCGVSISGKIASIGIFVAEGTKLDGS